MFQMGGKKLPYSYPLKGGSAGPRPLDEEARPQGARGSPDTDAINTIVIPARKLSPSRQLPEVIPDTSDRARWTGLWEA